jgi:hypothetical protein
MPTYTLLNYKGQQKTGCFCLFMSMILAHNKFIWFENNYWAWFILFLLQVILVYSIQSAVLGPSLAYSWSILSNAAQTGNSIIYFKA